MSSVKSLKEVEKCQFDFVQFVQRPENTEYWRNTCISGLYLVFYRGRLAIFVRTRKRCVKRIWKKPRSAASAIERMACCCAIWTACILLRPSSIQTLRQRGLSLRDDRSDQYERISGEEKRGDPGLPLHDVPRHCRRAHQDDHAPPEDEPLYRE